MWCKVVVVAYATNLVMENVVKQEGAHCMRGRDLIKVGD